MRRHQESRPLKNRSQPILQLVVKLKLHEKSSRREMPVDT
ncbi:hypothetical protein TNIN_185501, partial [Trichonephila inaurata madagascariensis]